MNHAWFKVWHTIDGEGDAPKPALELEVLVRASGMAETGSVLREEAGTYTGPGDRRAGVMRHPAMQNPTLVVLTDRNELDNQLFGQFQRCADILGQTSVQASERKARPAGCRSRGTRLHLSKWISEKKNGDF